MNFVGKTKLDIHHITASEVNMSFNYPLETRQRFIEQRAAGLSYNAIAKNLDVNINTLLSWGNQLDSELKKLDKLNTDEILQEFKLAKTARLKFLASIIDKLLKEIDKRDYSDIATDKLLKLLLAYKTAFEDELEGSGLLKKHIFLNCNEIGEQ